VTLICKVGLVVGCISLLLACRASEESRLANDSSKAQGSAESPSASSAVQGVSASWLLAKQSNKHDDTMKALKEARDSVDMDASKRILRLRSIELAQAIDEVNTGSYSITDKQKMLKVLEQEKDWADSSLASLQ
jgi:hypothetical protein